jgi:hypothetical protein
MYCVRVGLSPKKSSMCVFEGPQAAEKPCTWQILYAYGCTDLAPLQYRMCADS